MSYKKMFFCVFLISLSYLYISCGSPSYELNNNTSFTSDNINYCLIDLRGEVMYPGIYKIKQGSYLFDVIELAGGLTDNANITNISLVTQIDDNMKIIIPTYENVTDYTNNLININTATLSELMNIPKIGESKANAIIEYRNKKGGFSSIEEIKEVSGIGDGLYEEIKAFITI